MSFQSRTWRDGGGSRLREVWGEIRTLRDKRDKDLNRRYLISSLSAPLFEDFRGNAAHHDGDSALLLVGCLGNWATLELAFGLVFRPSCSSFGHDRVPRIGLDSALPIQIF